jgi:acyl-CoA thioester hydrolase
MTELAGITVTEGTVVPGWIDINGHMNVAFYVLAFDKAVDDLWAQLGITEDYIRSGAGTTFAVECHVTYQRELREGDRYVVTSQILAYDEKRIHQFQRMYHAGERFLSATAEWMNLHVDLATRRVAPWPESVLQALSRLTERQQAATAPQEAGKQMRIAKPIWSMQARDAG